MRLTTPYRPYAMMGVDVNNDGKLDLVVSTREGVMVFLGHGDGSFDHAGDYYSDVGHYMAVADFNRDGNADIADGRRLFLGDGHGNFASYKLPELSHYDDSWLVGADFDGDGWPDLVAGDASHDVIEIYRNRH
jgi:VCBS repeat protein